jgi:hypothetical protein
MSVVKVEFQIKGGDKVTTTNETIIKQLIEQQTEYKVLEGDINSLVGAQEQQNESTQGLTKSYQEVLAEYKANEKELKALAIAGDTTSARYQELAASVGASRAALEDVNKEANINKGAFDAVLGSLGGVAAGFSAFQGALGLVGAESENVEKALLKVQSALSLSQGLDQFQKSIPAFKNLGTLIKGPVVASFTTLKGAIAATGIGLLAIAIGLVVANWDKLVDALRTAFPAFAVIEEFFADFKNIAFGAIAGVVEGFKVVGDVIANIFKGNFTQAIAEAKNFGTRVGAAYQQGYNKSVEDEARAGRITQLEEELAFAEARGEETLALEKKLIQEKIAAAKEGSKELKELRIEEARIDTQITKKRQEDAKTAEERITAIRKANAERRIALLNDGLQKELATLKLRYEEERKAAKKNGEDLKLVDELYQKQRGDLIKNSLQNSLKELESFSEQTLKLSSLNYLKELASVEENFKKLQDGNKKNREAIIKEKGEEAEELNQINETIEKANEAYLIRKANVDEKYLKEAQKLYEDYQTNFVDINLFQFNLADLETNLNDLASIIEFNQREILNDEITYRRRLFDIAFEADDNNFALAVDKFKKIRDLNDREFDFINARTRTYLQEEIDAFVKNNGEITNQNAAALNKRLEAKLAETREKSAIDKKALDDELIAFRNAESAKLKARAEFKVQGLVLTKVETRQRLDSEIKYYRDLGVLNDEFINKNFVKRVTGLGKLLNQEQKLQRKFQEDELNRQKKLLDLKLAAAKKAFGEESEEYKKLQLEKAKLEKQSTDQSIQDTQRRLQTFTQLFQQFLSTLAEVGAAADSFYELQAARTNAFYDGEVKKNTEANNNEINNYALTEEEKQNINERYALKETKLEEDRSKRIKKIEKERADVAFALQIAQIIGNGALAVTRAFAELGPVAGIVAAGLIGITVGAQIVAAENQRKVAAQLEDGGLLFGASHSSGGIPVGNTGISVEGGEAVINKRSTARFLPMLSAINQAGGGVPLMPNTSQFMQTGGIMMGGQTTSSTVMKTYVVSEDVTSKQVMDARIRRQSQF